MPPTQPLAKPPGDQAVHIPGQRATHTGQREHPDRRRKHRLGAKPVGAPTADRDEDRQRNVVGGEGQLQTDRVHAQVRRHRRQGCGNDGADQALHEERAGDDKGEETGGGHLRQQLVVVAVAADPEPVNRVFARNAQGAVVKPDPDAAKPGAGQCLECQRRVRGRRSEQLVALVRKGPDVGRKVVVAAPEALGRGVFQSERAEGPL